MLAFREARMVHEDEGVRVPPTEQELLVGFARYLDEYVAREGISRAEFRDHLSFVSMLAGRRPIDHQVFGRWWNAEVLPSGPHLATIVAVVGYPPPWLEVGGPDDDDDEAGE